MIVPANDFANTVSKPSSKVHFYNNDQTRYLVRCPRCKREQIYTCRTGILQMKYRVCIKCDKRFRVHVGPTYSNVIKRLT